MKDCLANSIAKNIPNRVDFDRFAMTLLGNITNYDKYNSIVEMSNKNEIASKRGGYGILFKDET